jgi:Holliday junction resolvase RusA-like endonuclease
LVETRQELIRAIWLASGRPRLEGPLTATLVFHYARPEAHYRKDGELRSTAPEFPSRHDVDNLAKLVLDALNGLLYDDDRQITVLMASKTYATTAQTLAAFATSEDSAGS